MDAAEDGARGFPGELLIDDRPNECVEVSPFSPRLETARTDAVDDAREHRIDALEMTNGGRVHGGKNARPSATALRLPFARCAGIPRPVLRQLAGYLLEIGEEVLFGLCTGVRVRRTQHRRRMHRRDDCSAIRCLHRATAFLGDLEALSHDRLRGGGAEADDDLRPHEANL